MRVYFLPAVIFISAAMLVTKSTSLLMDKDKILQAFKVSELHAEQAENKGENQDASPQQEQSQDQQDGASTHTGSQIKVSEKAPLQYNCQNLQFGSSELEVLQNLAKRRQELESWSKSLTTKEAILQAAEGKVDKKVKELKTLKVTVDQLLAEYNVKEDIKISSLVKIYENMKPKDAAKIFEGLEMPILLQVIDRMKEAKVAPILAQMDPQKATLVTEKFAKQKQVPATINP